MHGSPQYTGISSLCLLVLWSARRELVSVAVSGAKSGAAVAHANQSHVAMSHSTLLATKGSVIILESMTHPGTSVTKANVLNMFRGALITLQRIK